MALVVVVVDDDGDTSGGVCLQMQSKGTKKLS